MLPRRKQKPAGIRDDARKNAAHLKWVRGFVCVCWRAGGCDGKIEAHHVRENGNGGTGLKPPDADVVPLCSLHHAELHSVGKDTFQAAHGVKLMAEAVKLARVSPHLRKP